MYDNRNLFQKQENWQGFLSTSATVFTASPMIHIAGKMFGAALLLNCDCDLQATLPWASQTPCELCSQRQNRTHTRLDCGFQSRVTSEVCGRDACSTQLREACSCPEDEPRSVLCIPECQPSAWGRGCASPSSPVVRTQMAPALSVARGMWGGCWAASQRRWMTLGRLGAQSWPGTRGVSRRSRLWVPGLWARSCPFRLLQFCWLLGTAQIIMGYVWWGWGLRRHRWPPGDQNLGGRDRLLYQRRGRCRTPFHRRKPGGARGLQTLSGSVSSQLTFCKYWYVSL